MSTVTVDPSPATPPEDRVEPQHLGDVVRAWWTGVRGGELGSLPIVVGLIIVAIVFQTANSQFLTAGNFVNLMVQMGAITVVGMGIVFVLLLGEIDLSIGFVSGVAGVLVALLLLPGETDLPVWLVLIMGVASGAVIGALQGVIITKVGIPSFVVTLAGLLAWNGVVLVMIGSRGTVVIQDQTIVDIANSFLAPATAWILLAAGVALYAGVLVLGRVQRRRAGLPAEPLVLVVLRVAGLALVGAAVVLVSNEDRGIPIVLVLIAVFYILWTYVLARTKFGLHVYAIGGNTEAARRAGINTDGVRIACFVICSAMAAVGGIILASRLRSVDTGAGGGTLLLYSIAAAVIGGTSLFGGRGHIKSAVLGALVIASIDNGLGLLGLSAGVKFIITGLVLLAAVAVDSLSRRRQERTGRA